MMDFALDYLGKPWVMGANGPESFDCWGLLEDIYLKQKGIELPRYSELNKGCKLQVAKQIADATNSQWIELEKPSNLCAVALSQLPNKFFHVGCFIEKDSGYVIHSQQNFGCIIEPLDKIKSNWKYIRFYGLR